MKILCKDLNKKTHSDSSLYSFAFFSAAIFFAYVGMVQSSHASPPFCSEIFQNGVQAHSSASFIDFAFNAQLLNGSGSELSAVTVQTKPWSVWKSCVDTDCTANGGTSQRLYGPSPKTTSATNKIIIPPHNKVFIPDTNTYEFGEVNISEWGTGVFSGNRDVYVIDQLTMSYRSTLRLSAGNYWIRHLTLEVQSKIEVIGEGTVNLYIIDPLMIPLSFAINENTKNPARFSLYSYKDVQLYVSSRIYGFVQTETDFTLFHKAKVVGGVNAGNIFLKDESLVKYDSVAAQALAVGSLCRAE